MTQKQIAITDTAFAKEMNKRLDENRASFNEAAARIQKEAQERLDDLGKLHTEQNNTIWKDIYEHVGIPEDERKGWEFQVEFLEETGIAFVMKEQEDEHESCSCGDPNCGSGGLGEALLRGLIGRG